MNFIAERSTRSHSFTLDMPVGKAFPLFEPEGERAWAKGWDPVYVHPPSGKAEQGMVFTTSHGGEDTIWMLIRHEPASGIVEYARVTPGSRTATVLVQCAAMDAGRHTYIEKNLAFNPLSACVLRIGWHRFRQNFGRHDLDVGG